MVLASKFVRSPVVSLLSESPAASRAAQELVKNLFSMEPIMFSSGHHADDDLDAVLKNPLFSRRFDSVASKCPSSGTVLHFVSLTTGGANSTNESQSATNSQHFSLLGITSSSKDEIDNDIKESRRMIASRIRSPLRLLMNHAVGRPISASAITRFDSGLPFLDLPTNNNSDSIQSTQTGLKELVVPFYDDSLYPDGQSLLSLLGSSTLNRPAVGLYQWPNGIAIRPLPSAKEDRVLPAPSLVFYCRDLEEAAAKLEANGAISSKIGYNGLDKSGQLMVSHASLLGLDIRLTDCIEYSSAFPEAQDALLASSLVELQNVNVLKGDTATESEQDARDNNMDCWVEFRANMKRPSGYIKRIAKAGKVKTATAPDIPYE
jgi:hypothetical protein